MARISPTGVNAKAFDELVADMGDRMPILLMLTMSDFLKERCEEGDISYLAYALTDISNHMINYQSGAFDLEEYNYARSKVGDACVLVSIDAITALSDAWLKYLQAPEGTTLGEAFGLEGRGQGKRPVRDKIKRAIRDFSIAGYVNEQRFRNERAGTPISYERAYELAQKELEKVGQPLSTDTIKDAYRRNREFLMRQRRMNGLGE